VEQGVSVESNYILGQEVLPTNLATESFHYTPMFSSIPGTNPPIETPLPDDPFRWQLNDAETELWAQEWEILFNNSTGEASSTSGSMPLPDTSSVPEDPIGEASQLSWDKLKDLLVSNPTREEFHNTEGFNVPGDVFDPFFFGEDPPPEAVDQNLP
jgi:hypothetical protein